MTEYRPSDDEERQFAARLNDLILWGLANLKEQAGVQTAIAVAEQFDRRQYRLKTRLELERRRRPGHRHPLVPGRGVLRGWLA